MKTTAIVPWYDTLGYAISLVKEGILSIDQDGRVWRHFVKLKQGMKPVTVRRAEFRTQKGYLSIVLGVPRTRVTRSVLAHVLVWVHANGSIPGGLQINHKDLNKTNNRLSNLEVVTGAENTQHAYDNGRTRPWRKCARNHEWRPGKPLLTPEKKQQVVALRSSGRTYREIRFQTGISLTHISRILKRASL